mmetsp:Transcript_11790/g.14687  ORF Transcript_11790/g.14687 Transcript_11790/m.14687 type:complete len:246 (+) Transcript_11790:264-1001(+)
MLRQQPPPRLRHNIQPVLLLLCTSIALQNLPFLFLPKHLRPFLALSTRLLNKRFLLPKFPLPLTPFHLLILRKLPERQCDQPLLLLLHRRNNPLLRPDLFPIHPHHLLLLTRPCLLPLLLLHPPLLLQLLLPKHLTQFLQSAFRPRRFFRPRRDVLPRAFLPFVLRGASRLAVSFAFVAPALVRGDGLVLFAFARGELGFLEASEFGEAGDVGAGLAFFGFAGFHFVAVFGVYFCNYGVDHLFVF